jgi:hypothetical protein
MVLKGEPEWICITCCNADILFTVIVLHWVTSKENKEDVTARSDGYTGSKSAAPGNGTVKSHMSRRVSFTDADRELEKKHAVSHTAALSPGSEPGNPLQCPTIIKTECKSATPQPGMFTNFRRGSEWDSSEPAKGQKEKEVELRKIHVHTIQTREVEIEGDNERSMSHSASASTDGEGDAWSRRGVVVERMV